MCGITVIVNGDLEVDVSKVFESLKHRGPDDSGCFNHKNITLIHTRLAIQDIFNSKQPMTLGNLVIVFNGEIYNHKQLRDLLPNVKWQTTSDTETLLHLYTRYKESCLSLLDGMFAFAIYDKDTHTIFLARDRAGKKPLYIYKKDSNLIIASELNAIRFLVPLDVDNQGVYQYLRLGSCYRKQTPFRNVTEFESGTYAYIDCDSLNVREQTWWSIEDQYLNNRNTFCSMHEAIETVDLWLNHAIKSRLESSDLEVGAFLSGGIDSGLIAAIASKYKQRLKTFTVKFPCAFDESFLANKVVERYKTDHVELSITYDHLQNDLERIIFNYGEPFADSSAIPSYYVSREAKKYITVALNGDGADELFGGYRRYVPFRHFDFFSEKSNCAGILRFINWILPGPKYKNSKYNYIYRLVHLMTKQMPVAIYLATTSDIFEGYEGNLVVDGDYFDVFKRDITRIVHLPLTALQKIMILDFNTLLFSDLLVKMDIATMANSLEGRSPFLAKELLDMIPRLPDNYKICGLQTKYLLRKLAERYLPKDLVFQPKRGFEVPLVQWMTVDLKEITYDLLTMRSYVSQFVKKSFYSRLLEDKMYVYPEKRAKMLWTLLCLEIWYKSLKCKK